MNTTQSQTDVRAEVRSHADQVTHLTCCRSSWQTSFCGMRAMVLDLNEGEDACSMCVEEVLRLRPSALDEEEFLCPHDGTPCPADEELDAKAERFLGLRP